jgi:hypothetical protein
MSPLVGSRDAGLNSLGGSSVAYSKVVIRYYMLEGPAAFGFDLAGDPDANDAARPKQAAMYSSTAEGWQ